MTVYLVCSLDDGPGPNDGVVLEVKVGRESEKSEGRRVEERWEEMDEGGRRSEVARGK